MRRLGPVTFDFAHQRVQLRKDGQQVTLQGLQAAASLKMISGKQILKMLYKGRDSIFGYLCTITAAEVIQESKTALEIHELVSQFTEIFDTPAGLPPLRGHDRHIHIKARAKPFKIHPYRYPHL